MKILVLGGTGAIGMPCVKILADEGNCVYVTSRQNRSNKGNIHYLKGNAHDLNFVKSIILDKYDVLIDFMVYSEEELKERVGLLLGNVNQYFFISSARVYDNSDVPLTEDSARLLDSSIDQDYLNTKEYALTKAREEDIIRNSGYKNWTIIRPYITYSTSRFQLGVLEKEHWLYRALAGKTIVFSTEIAEKYTTMTWGDDVSRHIAKLVGKSEALEKVFHITNDAELKWSNVLRIYKETIEEETGKPINILMNDNNKVLNQLFGNYYQLCYDRMYNRRFNSAMVNQVTNDYDYADTSEQLKKCLSDFLNGDIKFLDINWRLEGYLDRLTKERTRISEIKGIKHKLAYFIYRYTLFIK